MLIYTKEWVVYKASVNLKIAPDQRNYIPFLRRRGYTSYLARS
jgi:hypothetical protein